MKYLYFIHARVLAVNCKLHFEFLKVTFTL